MLLTLLLIDIDSAAAQDRTPQFPDGFYEIMTGPGRCVGSANCLDLGNDSTGLMAFWFPNQGVPSIVQSVNRGLDELPSVAYIGDYRSLGFDPATGLEVIDGFMVAALDSGDRGRVNTRTGTVNVKAQRINGPTHIVQTVIDYRTGLPVNAYMGWHTLEQECDMLSRTLNVQNRMTYEDDDCPIKKR